jgi:hypothetical protein
MQKSQVQCPRKSKNRKAKQSKESFMCSPQVLGKFLLYKECKKLTISPSSQHHHYFMLSFLPIPPQQNPPPPPPVGGHDKGKKKLQLICEAAAIQRGEGECRDPS